MQDHKSRIFSAAAITLSLSACVMHTGERKPNLIASGTKPTLTTAPRIEVVLHHRHTMDGADAGGQFSDLTFAAMQKSFDRVRAETRFLAEARSGVAKPEYVLDFDTEVAEHGKAMAIVSGATLLLVPGFTSSDVKVTAALKDADGREISRREASGELKLITHLLFFPILPITLATAPGDNLYDDTFRDVLLGVSRDLEKHLARR